MKAISLIDLLNRYYSKIDGRPLFGCQQLGYLWCLAVRIFVNLAVPAYYLITARRPEYCIYSNDEPGGRVIVSLTTYPDRIGRVWMVVESILRQSRKPDAVILWLSREQFSSLSHLPQNLLRLRKRGLQIELRDGDLKSFKKYYYTLAEYPNDHFITVDDDVLYPSCTIDNLVSTWHATPESVVCRYGSEIGVQDGAVLPYRKWGPIRTGQVASQRLFFAGAGGTYFPAGSLHLDALNKEVFMELCPRADDIWLNAMVRLNGKTVVSVDCNCTLLPVLFVKRSRLYLANVGEDQNDDQFSAVRKYCSEAYGIDPFAIENERPSV